MLTDHMQELSISVREIAAFWCLEELEHSSAQ